MSNCRNTYNNYGSYLRSRGYDKHICNLATMIENGQINLGIIDGNVGDLTPARTALVDGNLVVRNQSAPMPATVPGVGQIISAGGDVTGPASGLGIQARNGIDIDGPVIQAQNSSTITVGGKTYYNSNLFTVSAPSGEHFFVGGPINAGQQRIVNVDGIDMAAASTNRDITQLRKLLFANGASIEEVGGSSSTSNPKLRLNANLILDASGWIADLSGVDPTGVVNVKVDGVTQFDDRVNIDDHLDVINTVTIHGGVGPGLDMCNNEIVDLSYVLFSNGATINANINSTNLDVSCSQGIDLLGGDVTIEKKLTVYGLTTIDNSLVMLGNLDMCNNHIVDVSSITFMDGTQFLKGNSFDISTSEAVHFVNTPLVKIDNSLSVLGKANIGSDLNVAGNTTIDKSLVMLGNLDMCNNHIVDVSSITFMDGTQLLHGNSFDISTSEPVHFVNTPLVKIDNSLLMLGNLDMCNNHIVDVSSITFMDGTQFLHGNSFDISTSEPVHFVNTPLVKIDNSLSVVGNANIAGFTAVDNSLVVFGNVDICGRLHVPEFNVQKMVVFKTLDTCGNAYMNIVDITGLTTIDNSLVMLGNIDMCNNHIVDVSSITFMDGTQFLHGNSFDISSAEDIHFVGSQLLKIDNNFYVGGTSTLTGNVTISGDHSCSDLVALNNLSLQVQNGTNIVGPIMQSSNNSLVKLPFEINGTVYHEDSNLFTGKKHVFTSSNHDEETDLYINGNLIVTGKTTQVDSTRQQQIILEDEFSQTNKTFFQLYNDFKDTNLDLFQVWNAALGYDEDKIGEARFKKTSLVEEIDGKTSRNPNGTMCYIRFKDCIWRRNLQVAIDGDQEHNPAHIPNKTGATDIYGQVRNLRGTTFVNPTLDGCYNIIDNTYKTATGYLNRYAQNVYGGMFMREGTTFDGSLNTRTWTVDISTSTVIDISASSGNLIRQRYENCDSVGYYYGTMQSDFSYNSTIDGSSNIQFYISSYLTDPDKWCPIVFSKEDRDPNCPAFPIQIMDDDGSWVDISGDNIRAIGEGRPHRLRAYPWVEISGNNARIIQYDASDAPQGFWLSGQHAKDGKYPIFNKGTIWNVDISHGQIWNRVDISNGRDIWNGQNNFNRGWIQGENFVSISGEIAIGYNKLRTKLTDQSYNLGGGYSTPWDLQNISIGNGAMRDIEPNASATRNIALGNYSLMKNNGGYDNIAIGTDSLINNLDGFDNVAIGRNTLLNGQYSQQNVAIGNYSLANNQTSQQNNTAIGYYAGYGNGISGEFNPANIVAIGFETLKEASGNFTNITTLGNKAMFEASGNFTNTIAIGSEAMYEASGNFTNTIAIGNKALYDVCANLIHTIAIGSEALKNTNADDNIAIGDQALSANTKGTSNIAIGHLSLKVNDEADNNIAIGSSALAANNNGNSNIAIGKDALTTQSGTTNNNIAIGTDALTSNISGTPNIAIGTSALKANTTGSNNIAIGDKSIEKATIVANNIGIGDSTLTNTTVGNNIAIGPQALTLNTSGTPNIAIGTEALANNKKGIYNVAMGYQALKANVDGSYNIAIGAEALTNNTKGINNIAMGYQALNANVDGSYNIAIGDEALTNNTKGIYNVAMGHQALKANVDGSYNIAIGAEALANSTKSIHNIAIGDQALKENVDGSYNIAIGKESLANNTKGIHNISIGDQALANNKNGINNIAMGYQALNANVDGSYNIAIGKESLANNTKGNHNVAIGYKALNTNVDGSFNIAIGDEALTNNTKGINNIAMGHKALNANVDGSYNIAIGDSALESNTGGSSNIALGYQALNANTTQSNSIAIGDSALKASTSTAPNIAIGTSALNSNTSGSDNVAIGYHAMRDNSTGSSNTAIGYDALLSNTGSDNTVLGYKALPDGTGSNNIAIGRGAAGVNSSGSGSQNITIGRNADISSSSNNNSIVIGSMSGMSGFSGKGSQTAVIGGVENGFYLQDVTDVKQILKVDLTSDVTNFTAYKRFNFNSDVSFNNNIQVNDSLTTQKFGLGSATPVTTQTTTGTTGGFTPTTTDVSGAMSSRVHKDSTFTGNVGGGAYTIGDIVRALKNLGILQ